MLPVRRPVTWLVSLSLSDIAFSLLGLEQSGWCVAGSDKEERMSNSDIEMPRDAKQT